MNKCDCIVACESTYGLYDGPINKMFIATVKRECGKCGPMDGLYDDRRKCPGHPRHNEVCPAGKREPWWEEEK